MNSEAKVIALGDALSRVIDHRGRTPKKLGGDFVSSGVPVISAKNIKNSRLEVEPDGRCVTEEMWNRWMPEKLRLGDVLLTSEAPLGETAYLNGEHCYCLGQRLFALRPKPDVLNGRYLHYALRDRELKSEILGRASGTTAQGIRQAELVKVEMRVPPLPEQSRISRVLAALDDKIANNTRLSKTLEEIVTALFKARFVDFVGHDDLADSEVGLIPAGWEVKPVGDVLTVVGGSTPSTKESIYWDGGDNYWATPKDLSGLREPVLLGTARCITDAGVEKITSKKLPVRTVLLSSRAPVGYTAIAMVETSINQGFIAIPPNESIPSEYVLLWIRNHLDEIKAHAGGTTFAEISKRAFRPLRMLVPPQDELDSFRSVVEPILDRIAATARESSTLEATRDALLPKLIAGELRVSEDALGGIEAA